MQHFYNKIYKKLVKGLFMDYHNPHQIGLIGLNSAIDTFPTRRAIFSIYYFLLLIIFQNSSEYRVSLSLRNSCIAGQFLYVSLI